MSFSRAHFRHNPGAFPHLFLCEVPIQVFMKVSEAKERQGRYLREMFPRLVYGSKFIRRSRSWKRGSSRMGSWLVGRHQAFEFFKPVENDDYRRLVGRGGGQVAPAGNARLTTGWRRLIELAVRPSAIDTARSARPVLIAEARQPRYSFSRAAQLTTSVRGANAYSGAEFTRNR